MSIACLGSYTMRGFHFMLGHEGKADAAAGIYCYAVKAPLSVMLDTPCQHAPYVNSRLIFFYWTQFMGDRWQRLKHTCRRVFNPAEFSRFGQTNSSFIEQYRAFKELLRKWCWCNNGTRIFLCQPAD
jgi:hypothetical protein